MLPDVEIGVRAEVLAAVEVEALELLVLRTVIFDDAEGLQADGNVASFLLDLFSGFNCFIFSINESLEI